MNSLSNRISDLEADVEDLQDDVSSSGDVAAEVTDTDYLSIQEGDDDFIGYIDVTVTNDTDDDIEDIVLEVIIEADEYMDDFDHATLTGGGITWAFRSAGEDDDMTLTLHVYFDPEATVDTSFDAEVDVYDYDIV